MNTIYVERIVEMNQGDIAEIYFTANNNHEITGNNIVNNTNEWLMFDKFGQ